MTLNEFKSLSKETMYFHLRENAVQLVTIPFEQHALSLLQIDSFYIEIKYSYIKERIDQVNAFDDVKLLDPYLEEMETNELEHLLTLDF